MKKRINWKILITSLVIVYAIALIGSLFTSPYTDSEWYESIKPSITPPNWIFPIVWNILFFLIALSLYFAWVASNKRAKDSKGRLLNLNITKKKIIIFYGINFLLNVLWSILFFTMKKPLYAFFDLILLWFSILYLIIFTYKIDKKSSYLLIPYFLWVSFAGVLNWLMV